MIPGSISDLFEGDILCSYLGWLFYKGLHALRLHALFRNTTFLKLSIAAAHLFSLCLKHLVLAPVSIRPPLPDKAYTLTLPGRHSAWANRSKTFIKLIQWCVGTNKRYIYGSWNGHSWHFCEVHRGTWHGIKYSKYRFAHCLHAQKNTLMKGKIWKCIICFLKR